ncbi:MAG TPA: MFS transporter [Balneolaceae bacterium]
MKLKPSDQLSRRDTLRGLDLVIKEGLTAEAMITLTGGTFLTALAVLLGASNFQIGLIAALPSLTNAFQILAIRLMQRYNNRRAIAVVCNGLARLPLLLIGALPLLFSQETTTASLIFLLFFHYFFGSVAGPSVNSWMKDLVPEKRLGNYFSRRNRMTQTLNVCLSLVLALLLDYIEGLKGNWELITYAWMFLAGGGLGLIGTWLLSRTPEPRTYLPKQNLLQLYRKPFKDKNYRSFLMFHAAWSFSLSIATPFITVFMLKALSLNLSTIIMAGIVSQIAGIMALKVWGKYADRCSNKTVVRLAAPLLIISLFAWPLADMAGIFSLKILIVILINILSGIANAGIGLSLTNIGMKLAPKNESIVYLSAKSMVIAVISALGPIAGGILADLVSKTDISWTLNLAGHSVQLLHFDGIAILFLIAAVLSIFSLKILQYVRERGEVSHGLAAAEIREGFKVAIKKGFSMENVASLIWAPVQRTQRMSKKWKNMVPEILKSN